MNEERRQAFEDEVTRLQGLLGALEGLGDPAAAAAARELVQVVLGLHREGLADLLAIVNEANTQPADTLLPRFAANPAVRGLLLLHDLHPDDLATRVRNAVARLRPHLGVQGARADLVAVDEHRVVTIRVSASGQKSQRPAASALRREIEQTVWELAPDAERIVVEGLEATSGAREAYVPLAAIARSRAAGL